MIPTHTIEDLLSKVEQICAAVEEAEKQQIQVLDKVHPTYRKSAANLIHYRAFRQFDLRKFQVALRNLGMSRFAHSEGHIKASLMNARVIFQSILAVDSKSERTPFLSLRTARSLLRDHTRKLLGKKPQGRRVRIMVTLPSEAASQYKIVLELVRNGMNLARINCAHDHPEAWSQMVKHVKKASAETGREVRIAMDLAGPKLRTGPFPSGPRVLRIRLPKDAYGKSMEPVPVYLVPEDLGLKVEGAVLPVTRSFFSKLKPGDLVRFKDARGKKRNLKVQEINPEEVITTLNRSAYIKQGTKLKVKGDKSVKSEVGSLPALEEAIMLKTGDVIRVYKHLEVAEPAEYAKDGKLKEPARIPCMLPEIVDRVKTGDAILFDDGKIEGRISQCTPEYFEVRISRARKEGSKLRSGKGINLPDTHLGLSGLTAADREHLKFIAAHADIVNFSFVNGPEDVQDLLQELERLGVKDKLSVVLKIETRAAVENLVSIMLEAMRTKYVGVMIARGDLAVETGWDHIGRVQEEILSFCGAAHIPVIWATQVLENLARTGLPSRSEITDATASLKAECVMLNKGKYINDAVKLLDRILSDMENFRVKKERMLPKLEV